MLNGIFASVYGSSLTFGAFCITTLVSLSLGALLAFAYSREKHSSGSLTRSLLVLPFLVHMVILLVNGNLGAGVAVAGTFSLVRFRSAPGSARDIAVIFLAMTVGLACGMGYAALAVLAVVIVCAVLLIPGQNTAQEADRVLRVTVPENLDYMDLFTDLFEDFTTQAQLTRVKTVNMGSLYSLEYQVRLKETAKEKQLLDAMRCRNGNLNIVCAREENRAKQVESSQPCAEARSEKRTDAAAGTSHLRRAHEARHHRRGGGAAWHRALRCRGHSHRCGGNVVCVAGTAPVPRPGRVPAAVFPGGHRGRLPCARRKARHPRARQLGPCPGVRGGAFAVFAVHAGNNP